MAQKEYYGLKCSGKFRPQNVAGLPTWTPEDEGRLVYDSVTDTLYYGDSVGWVMGGSGTVSLSLESYTWYPEILTPSGTLSLSKATGQIYVDNGQEFLIRSSKILTDDFSGRLFTTAINKTYHLRFVHDVSGNAFYSTMGIAKDSFYLIDVANSTYNPTALAESDPTFDSRYDDMLIAKIVTNASNILTVTALKNARILKNGGVHSGDVTTEPANWTDFPGAVKTLNWSRKPSMAYTALTTSRSDKTTTKPFTNPAGTEGTSEMRMTGFKVGLLTRYSLTPQFVLQTSGTVGGYLQFNWFAWA